MAKASIGRETPSRAESAAPVVAKPGKAMATAPRKPAPVKTAPRVKKTLKITQATAKAGAAKRMRKPLAQGSAPVTVKAMTAATVAHGKVTAAAKAGLAGKRHVSASPAGAAPPTAGRSAPRGAAKVIAAKQIGPRRPATRTAVLKPAARRMPAAVAPRKAPPARGLADQAPQAFTVSHLNEADFKADGLRSYALYRDLAIAAATGGRCQAHVIRMLSPCTDAVRKRHLHHTDLQLVYVLKGWMKNEFEGHGEQMMSTGSCWLQPSGIKHTVLDYSPDCEVLEIIIPADFRTEETS